MSVVALCSAHGAPGVTTAALALCWSWPQARADRRVLLVDADPAGSGLLTGYLSPGVPDSVGVSVLAAARGALSPEQVIGCSLALDAEGTRMVLPGVADPVQARPLASMWTALVSAARDLSDAGVDVVVDIGRVGHQFEPRVWLTQADLVGVVVAGTVASVAPAAAAVRGLAVERAGRLVPVGVVTDAGGYSRVQIAEAMGVTEVLELVADEWAARSFAAGEVAGWRFERSPLLRAARAAVERIGALVPERAVLR